MYQITKSYHFIAAHTIEGHPKCGRMHGHNYQVDVTLEFEALDSKGFIVDFASMDREISPLLEKLDHMTIVSNANSTGARAYMADQEDELVRLDIEQSSAELLAQWFYKTLLESALGPLLANVTVWETPKARATYYVD